MGWTVTVFYRLTRGYHWALKICPCPEGQEGGWSVETQRREYENVHVEKLSVRLSLIRE